MAKRQTVDESVGGDPATVELPPAVVEQQQGMFRDVYRAIGAVMLELARHGIGKTSVNQQQGYRFRGIDAVYNALSPAMVRAGLVVLPRMLSREWVERSTKSGTALFSVTVEAEFDFISIADGSSHTVKTYGEAMDSGDKATNKAMSAAYKYAAMQAFCIPTEGDNDAEATTHEVKAAADERPRRAPRQQTRQTATNSNDQRPITTGTKDKPGQLERLWAIFKASGRDKDIFKAWLKSAYGYNGTAEIQRRHYDAIIAAIQSQDDDLPMPETEQGREPGEEG